MIINLGKLIYNGKLDLQQEKFAANLIHRSLPDTKFYILEALQAEIQTITRKFYEGNLLEWVNHRIRNGKQ